MFVLLRIWFTQSIRMDIAASHVVEKAGPFFGQRLRVAFHKEHAFISERTWPVSVNLNTSINTVDKISI